MRLLLCLTLFGLISSGFCQRFCQTPNNDNARCIPLNECKIFIDAIQSNPSESQLDFLRQSKCGYTKFPWVCCGEVANYRQISTTTQRQQMQTDQNADPRIHRHFNLLPTVGKCGGQFLADKVLGGTTTDLDEFPWMALLEYSKDGINTGHSCGGALISDRYVLTAAHCVVGEIQTYYGKVNRIRLGEYDTSTNRDCRIYYEGEAVEVCADPHQDIEVEEYIAHPDYNLNGHEYNDIALIRLSRPVVINDFVQPICLPLNRESSPVGKNVTVAGWGQTANSTNSNLKLKADLPVVSQEDCTRVYLQKRRRLTDNQFCAGGLRGIDSCKGDSGGPIMNLFTGKSSWYVEGIVSYGPLPCGLPGWPGVYTKVASYVNWILDNMRP